MFVCYALGPFGIESTTNILAARCHGNNHKISVGPLPTANSEEVTPANEN